MYEPIFKPDPVDRADTINPENSVDRRDGSVYVFHVPDIALAVNVALATGRPLFLRGPTGVGKSSLARSVARIMGWRYYEKVISSRTTLQDLLWRTDAVKRLADAQAGELKETPEAYIEPGVLWWAFDPASARTMGAAPPAVEQDESKPAVVLLDEIDKADPDLPNDLLVPLGSLEFAVDRLEPVKAAAGKMPLVVITTNEEREMPPAFLRRCIVLSIPPPTRETMVSIAKAHFGDDRQPLYDAVIDKLQGQARASTAEALDTIHACIRLGLNTSSDEWTRLTALTLWKNTGDVTP